MDREGRINAHPTYLKGNVFLQLEYTEEQIGAAVWRFHDVGLATVYPTEDAIVMQYTAFEEFNKVDNREVASEYPAPSEELLNRPATIPSTSTKYPAGTRKTPSRVSSLEVPRKLRV